LSQVASVKSIALRGIEAIQIDVQAQLIAGIPAFTIVGLADKTIAESRERVRGALASIGLALPAKKILINLAPADLSKEGSHFDLAIACAILAHTSILPEQETGKYIILGELGLDGSILQVSGVLPAAVQATGAQMGIICPAANGKEAAWSGNENILAPTHLLDLINHFKGQISLPYPNSDIAKCESTCVDLKDVQGQSIAKRAIEIAAAGGHHLMLSGPPGSGKSMLAQCIPGILPPMSKEEILDCSMIHSVSGLIKEGSLASVRPFRSPHHSSSLASIVGGGIGNKVKPGEISLSHKGVLFLDEFPEFNQATLEALRQPLESGEILISRSNWHVKYPADFQLVAAMNPCKCGYLGDAKRQCSQAPQCGRSYIAKLSGPILDRFGIYVEVPYQTAYSQNTSSIDSATVRSRVNLARGIQAQRYAKQKLSVNARQAIAKEALVAEAQRLMDESAEKFGLSMRAYSNILKVARTIADLEASEMVLCHHISEAVGYRCLNYRAI
jgi:magnesium chelatase family protein